MSELLTLWLLAQSLICDDHPESFLKTWAVKDMMMPLSHMALHMELMDVREMRYLFARAEDCYGDLQMIRRRYRDMGDAPPLEDCYRFPERTVINEMLVFNRSFKKYVEERVLLDQVQPGLLRHLLMETDKLYEIWDLVRDARCEYYYVTVRRQAMKNLEKRIGCQNYFYGRLPPHVPLWHFQRIP